MSDKTIVQKLFLKPGQTLALVYTPEGYAERVGELPPGATVVSDMEKPADVILCFASSQTELAERLPAMKGRLKPGGALWVAYPKGTGKIKAGINRDTIRAYAPGLGLEAVSLFAMDDDWSALRLKVV